MIRSGNLDRRVVIQTSTESQGSTGEVTPSWSTFATVWASRRDTLGSERVRAGAETAMADAVFRIRWLSGVTAKMRLTEGSDVWDIVALAELGRREGLDLTCTRVRS
jgi:SPP1 family predicted phage head-tail adaptor